MFYSTIPFLKEGMFLFLAALLQYGILETTLTPYHPPPLVYKMLMAVKRLNLFGFSTPDPPSAEPFC